MCHTFAGHNDGSVQVWDMFSEQPLLLTTAPLPGAAAGMEAAALPRWVYACCSCVAVAVAIGAMHPVHVFMFVGGMCNRRAWPWSTTVRMEMMRL